MRNYEATIVIHPQLSEEELIALIDKAKKKIESAGGKIEKTDRMGKRRLQVTFQKHRKLTDAHYVMIIFSGESHVPKELENMLKITEEVLRFQVIRDIPIKLEPEEKAEEEKVEVAPEILISSKKERVG